MAEKNNDKESWAPRFILAIVVSSLVLVGIITFSCITIWKAADAGAAAKDVLTYTLPVFGTWVATVLAYYFNKENLDAAAKSVKDVMSMTIPEKLQSILVRDKMIPKNAIIGGKLPADKIIFSEVLDEINSKKKGDRYPIFDENDKLIRYVFHKSKIAELLAELALNGVSQNNLQSKTLKDVLDDPDLYEKYGKVFQYTFGTVDESATLMDAKTAMETISKHSDIISNCQDIFVTKGGKKENEVVGWITSGIILENSKSK